MNEKDMPRADFVTGMLPGLTATLTFKMAADNGVETAIPA